MLEVLARLHGAQRKLLRSQQASLWVALQKVGRGAAAIAHGSGDVPALLDAIEARSLVVEEQVHKLGVMRSYRDELAQELERQEALVAENNAVVAQVTAEVDEALDAAQRRYRQALQEVGVGGAGMEMCAALTGFERPPCCPYQCGGAVAIMQFAMQIDFGVLFLYCVVRGSACSLHAGWRA